MKIIKIIFFPFVLIWKAIKFIIVDTYLDLKFLWNVIIGKKKLVSYQMKQEWEKSDKKDLFKDVFKTYWWVYLLLIAAFLAGIFISSQYYQGKCNQFIYDNYIEEYEVFNNNTIILPFGNITQTILEETKINNKKELG